MVISREKAAQCGLSRFHTGRTCKAGHIAERYVSNKQCVQCNAESARERERKRCKAIAEVENLGCLNIFA